MVLGLLTGKKQKTKSQSESQFEQSQENRQTQEGTRQAESTRSSEQTGAQTQTQTGTETGSQTSTQTGTTTQTGTQTGRTQSFSNEALAALESMFGSAGEAAGAGRAAMEQLLAATMGRVSSFNPEEYVAATLRAADQQFRDQFDPSMNAVASAIGGTADTNSMAALLKARGESEHAARMGGVQAQATATANEIMRGNIAQAGNQAQAMLQDLLSIGELLKGGQTTGEQVLASTGTQTQTGTTDTTRSSAVQADTQTTQRATETQSLLEILNMIAEAEARARGTQSSKGESTTKSRGSLLDAIGGIVDIGGGIVKLGL